MDSTRVRIAAPRIATVVDGDGSIFLENAVTGDQARLFGQAVAVWVRLQSEEALDVAAVVSTLADSEGVSDDIATYRALTMIIDLERSGFIEVENRASLDAGGGLYDLAPAGRTERVFGVGAGNCKTDCGVK